MYPMMTMLYMYTKYEHQRVLFFCTFHFTRSLRAFLCFTKKFLSLSFSEYGFFFARSFAFDVVIFNYLRKAFYLKTSIISCTVRFDYTQKQLQSKLILDGMHAMFFSSYFILFIYIHNLWAYVREEEGEKLKCVFLSHSVNKVRLKAENSFQVSVFRISHIFYKQAHAFL